MIAVRRNARQKVNAITNVGPQHVWNYCGQPSFEVVGDAPEWFSVNDNKLTVTRSEDLEGIFTVNGTMSIGSYTEEGTIRAYVNTLVNCDELGDGTTDATNFLDWVASTKGVESVWDLDRNA